MSSTESTPTPRQQVNTRFFTRRVIFACGHSAQRVYPIRDLRGPSFHAARPPVPLFLALRLPDKCIPCLREAVYSRGRDNAKEARATVAALQGRLDKILKRVDEASETDETESKDEENEEWPDEPPAVAALIKGDSYTFASTSTSASTTTRKTSKTTGKLSENIRLLREDLERRMQGWSKTADAKGSTPNAAELSSKDLDEMSSYEAFEAKDVVTCS